MAKASDSTTDIHTDEEVIVKDVDITTAPVMKISALSDRKSLMLGIGFLSAMVLAIIASTAVAAREKWRRDDPIVRTQALMTSTPLIDGYNELASQLRTKYGSQIEGLDLEQDLSFAWDNSHTDIPRMREGRVGAQFWSAYVSCDAQYKDGTRQVLEQIDIIKRMVNKFPQTFKFVTSSKGITDAFNQDKIASLIGVVGGHSIDSSLASLRILYSLGVRYLTLTGDCNTPWADSHSGTPKNDGLSTFGKTVIREMNRLGMMIDLSDANELTMDDVLDITEAPVIFSHSAVYAKCANTRNIPDRILDRLTGNQGIIMINFDSELIGCGANDASLMKVADHIDYVRKRIGARHVGIGAGYSGIRSPSGLQDTSTYPDLITELIRRGWTDREVEDLLGKNLLQVFEWVENVRDLKLKNGVTAYEEDIQDLPSSSCRSIWRGPP
ncbi:dipeptidase 1-like [Glandiceps talaboti]